MRRARKKIQDRMEGSGAELGSVQKKDANPWAPASIRESHLIEKQSKNYRRCFSCFSIFLQS
jgi:hypothetical protein